MKLKFDEIKNELLRFCVIHCLSKMDEPLSKEFISDVHKNDGEMDLKLFADIDGSIVELSLDSFFDRLDENYHSAIKEKAEEIIKDKLYDMEEKHSEIMEKMNEYVTDIVYKNLKEVMGE